ncbi:MAG: hypothetical protein ACE5D7_09050 [Fidelibacterota bacterium]
MKIKQETLIFGTICIFGMVLVLLIFGNNIFTLKKDNEDPNPPQLTDLFPDRPNGPHQSFVSVESCLKCHAEGVEIPGMGTAPKIKHEVRENCYTCHKPKRS